MRKKISAIEVKSNVDSVVMPENVKIGLLISEHRKKCDKINCPFDYFAYAFGQSPFHVPPALEDALRKNVNLGHYSDAMGIKELKVAISEFNKRHFGFDVDSSKIFVGPGTKGIIFTIFSIIDADVVIPSPAWVSYVPQLKFLNHKYFIYHLSRENIFTLSDFIYPCNIENFPLIYIY